MEKSIQKLETHYDKIKNSFWYSERHSLIQKMKICDLSKQNFTKFEGFSETESFNS